jgi:hypothetical protein
MLYRIVIGAMPLSITALALCLMANDRCMAAGAVALGEPADIAKDGVAIFTQVNAANAKRAKELALAGCKALPNSSDTSKALCKIVATFENQCVAQALDPQNGDAGFWLGHGAQFQAGGGTGAIQLPRYGWSHAPRRLCRRTERPLVRRLRQIRRRAPSIKLSHDPQTR